MYNYLTPVAGDGTCVIEIRAYSSHELYISLDEIHEAASDIYSACVVGSPGLGPHIGGETEISAYILSVRASVGGFEKTYNLNTLQNTCMSRLTAMTQATWNAAASK